MKVLHNNKRVKKMHNKKILKLVIAIELNNDDNNEYARVDSARVDSAKIE